MYSNDSADRKVDLAVGSLSKTFEGDRQILDRIDLSVNRGESVALIGGNGCGKSTLLRCCLRLIEPDSGSVQLLGRDVTEMGRNEMCPIKSRIGLIFQKHNLVPRLSAMTNVIHGVLGRAPSPRNWLQCMASEAHREMALDCLERVKLKDFAKRRADTLSGGESQRVAIARALMQEPQLILADEPVASLDPKIGAEVIQLFVDLVRNQGITLLWVSHHLEHALKYSDRVVGMRSGRIELNAPPSELSEAELRKFYA
ncbi:MAG: phosphonate ABC transporter ATP-binding protein [Verrucomicrobiales bacterium]